MRDGPDHQGKPEGGFFLYAALAANFGIAVAKFVAAGLSGSSAMLSEGFHSLVDTGNELLLLYGRARSKKPADRIHPLGYGREIYFWSFVVSLLIFATGAGVSAYEGITHLLDPHPVGDATMSYAVLGLAFCLEGGSWFFAHRALMRASRGRGWYVAIRRSKDPPRFIVFLEDSAALIGIVVAGAGLFLSEVSDNPVYDGAASVLIGIILALVAVILAREAKHLLIGESADPHLEDRLRSLVERRAGRGAVSHLFTIQLAPGRVFAALRLSLPPHRQGRAAEMVEGVHEAVRKELPSVQRLSIEPCVSGPVADARPAGSERE